MSEDLSALNLSVPEAHQQALDNLSTLMKAGKVDFRRYENGPQKKPFIVAGYHWAAATCVLWPKLLSFCKKNLGGQEFLVCLPHRDVMLVFQTGNKEYQKAILQMVEEKEKDGRKPLAFELFKLSDRGLQPLKENA